MNMQKKLYFMLPNLETCTQLVTQLKQAGLHEDQIHIVAREGMALERLPKASLLQKTEVVRGIEVGLGVGGIAGILGGLLAVTFPPAGLAIGGGALILATTLAGAGFGSIVSGIIAADIPHHELEIFQSKIDQGEILLILDTPVARAEELIELIKSHHPQVKICVPKTIENSS
jgi:hypothetical protein